MFMKHVEFSTKDCKTCEQINYGIFFSDVNIVINIHNACYNNKQWLPCNWNLYYSLHITYVIKDSEMIHYH